MTAFWDVHFKKLLHCLLFQTLLLKNLNITIFGKRSGSGHKNRKPDPVGALHYGVPNVGPKGPPKPSTGVKRKSHWGPELLVIIYYIP